MARIVDTNTMPWQNGLEVIGSMAPEWRENLGPADLVNDAYGRYDQKNLRLDPDTTRRFDLIRLAPGYKDATYAYHDTAEECFVLNGSSWLGGEGTVHEFGYFWRPPGWIHTATSDNGLLALLVQQGKCDESGPATRRVRPAEDAGTNALTDDHDQAIGPRGFVKMLDSRLVPWLPGPVFARGEGALEGFDLDRVSIKTLSKNRFSGAQTLLVRLHPDYRQEREGRHTSGMEAFVISGSAALGKSPLPAGSYFQREAWAVEQVLSSDEGALLYMKVDGWLDFI